jgi:hypothetical protein
MPDLIQIVVALSGGVVGYGDVLWILTIAVCCLLVLSAIKLLSEHTAYSAPGPGTRRWPLVLLWAVIGVSLAADLPDWLGIPNVNDYTTPWHVTILCWTLASVLAALAFFKARSRHPGVAVLSTLAGLILSVALVDGALSMQQYGVTAPAALLYAAPLPLGGILLGWALATRRRAYALYLAAWFVALAMVGQRLYLGEMGTPMYRVEHLSSVPAFNPEYPKAVAMVSEATQAEALISVAYCLAAIALLTLPLLFRAPTLQASMRRLGRKERDAWKRVPESGGHTMVQQGGAQL